MNVHILSRMNLWPRMMHNFATCSAVASRAGRMVLVRMSSHSFNSISNDRIVNNLRSQVVCLDLQSIIKGDQKPLLLLPEIEHVVQKLNNRGTATYVFVPDRLDSVGYSLEDVHIACDLLHIPYHRIRLYPDMDTSPSAYEKSKKMKEIVLNLKAVHGYSTPIVTCLAEEYQFIASDHPPRVVSNMAKLGEFSQSDLMHTLNKENDTPDLIFNVLCRPGGVACTGNDINWNIENYGELLQKL